MKSASTFEIEYWSVLGVRVAHETCSNAYSVVLYSVLNLSVYTH